MAKLYENVFKAKNSLYARTYDTETKISSIQTVKHTPPIYIQSKTKTEYTSMVDGVYLSKVEFKTAKERQEQIKILQANNVRVYGNNSAEFDYIRETFGKPTDNDHPFRTLYLDIETAVLDDSLDRSITKDDWKPQGERAAMAVITSIQMYDTKNKEFYILGLEKDWENKNNFSSEYGKIRYIKCPSEEKLLTLFLELLNKLDPTVIVGWNSEGYDYPYITMRIARVLDKRNDIFTSSNRVWDFNRDILNGGYVKQLSPVGHIVYRALDTNFGVTHTFQWIGYILEDYQNLYKKYADAKLTSYSLSSVSGHELGDDKIDHDEFSDFAAFYRGDYMKYARNINKEITNETDLLYDEIISIDEELKKRGLDV